MTAKTTTYHIGLRHFNEKGQACPFGSVVLGGHSVPLYTEKVTGYGAETRRDRRPGAYVQLNKGEMARLKRELDNKVVRWRATRKWRDEGSGDLMEMRIARLLDKTARRFHANAEKDTTLHSWVYVVPREDLTPTDEQPEPDAVDTSAPWTTKGEKANA